MTWWRKARVPAWKHESFFCFSFFILLANQSNRKIRFFLLFSSAVVNWAWIEYRRLNNHIVEHTKEYFPKTIKARVLRCFLASLPQTLIVERVEKHINFFVLFLFFFFSFQGWKNLFFSLSLFKPFFHKKKKKQKRCRQVRWKSFAKCKFPGKNLSLVVSKVSLTAAFSISLAWQFYQKSSWCKFSSAILCLLASCLKSDFNTIFIHF